MSKVPAPTPPRRVLVIHDHATALDGVDIKPYSPLALLDVVQRLSRG